jgi:hypothetical protein
VEAHARRRGELPLETHHPLVDRGAPEHPVGRRGLDPEEVLDEDGHPAGRGEVPRIAATAGLAVPDGEGVSREGFVVGERVEVLLQEGLEVAAPEEREERLAVAPRIVSDAEARRHRAAVDQNRAVAVLPAHVLEPHAEGEEEASHGDGVAEIQGGRPLARLARRPRPEIEEPERAEGPRRRIEGVAVGPLRAVGIEVEEDLPCHGAAGQRVRSVPAGEVEPPPRVGLLIVDAGLELVVRRPGLEEPVGGKVRLAPRPALGTLVGDAVVEDGAEDGEVALRVAPVLGDGEVGRVAGDAARGVGRGATRFSVALRLNGVKAAKRAESVVCWRTTVLRRPSWPVSLTAPLSRAAPWSQRTPSWKVGARKVLSASS